ncbi:MAG: MotA/TolQ/ExbB proton channel family protein [Pseudomonadota bacterium]|nr:MotA/TolQ/ExbB proton channel family protein [Pseudomonadota bacterium]
MNGVADAMRDGGLFMWPILVVAVLGCTVALDRLHYVFLRAGIHAPAFMAQVQRAVLDGTPEQAVRLCNSQPTAALPRVLKAGLVRAGRPEAEVRDAMEEEQLEVTPLVRRRIGYLPMLAGVSILLGLLGTVDGFILAVNAIQIAAEIKPITLAAGIAVAMYPTFFGLLVSVPLLLAHGLVSARANAILEENDLYAVKLLNLLNATRQRPGSQGGGAPVLPFPL